MNRSLSIWPLSEFLLPHALGLMRTALLADVRERLIAEIDKDYAGRTATEVGQLLKGYEL